jgi:hypothetical protein
MGERSPRKTYGRTKMKYEEMEPQVKFILSKGSFRFPDVARYIVDNVETSLDAKRLIVEALSEAYRLGEKRK